MGIALAEMDGTNGLDIVTANYYGLSVLLQNADGTFGPATDYVGGYGTAVTLGDVNGDGTSDVLTFGPGNSSTVNVCVFAQQRQRDACLSLLLRGEWELRSFDCVRGRQR